jgi:hypothetical protein
MTPGVDICHVGNLLEQVKRELCHCLMMMTLHSINFSPYKYISCFHDMFVKWFKTRPTTSTPRARAPPTTPTPLRYLTTTDEALAPHIAVFEEAYKTACDVMKIVPTPRDLEGGTLKLGEDMQFFRDTSVVCVFWTLPFTKEEYATLKEDIKAYQKNTTGSGHDKYENVRYVTITHDDIIFDMNRDTNKNHINVMNYSIVHNVTSIKHVVRFHLKTFINVPFIMKHRKMMVYDMSSTSRAPKYIIADGEFTHVSQNHQKIYTTWNEAYDALTVANKEALEAGCCLSTTDKIYKILVQE